MKHEPKTLMEAIRFFTDPDIAREFVTTLRWPNGVACPTCGSLEVTYIPSVERWNCKEKHPRKQFSVKVGSIMEDSPIGLDKWLATIWMIANDKNGVSSYEVARSIGVTQKSAWFMLHRIRLAMEDGTFNKASGTVEVDETYIGGKARFMHKSKRPQVDGMVGKAAVMGFLERADEKGKSKVKATTIPDPKRRTIQPKLHENIAEGSNVYTDGAGGYRYMADVFSHGVVNHDAGEYVIDGGVHTNGIENFWSLLKRGLHGTYISVEPFHLFRYLDEQVFRFNSRDLTDGDRFLVLMRSLAGKRLTYDQLISSGTTPA
ncbi:MAG: IS1595 family transposase [Dehalococcoidia bacterium]|nr:MAG: IS1595 family transposase [Dehalococcoidia bacterium]